MAAGLFAEPFHAIAQRVPVDAEPLRALAPAQPDSSSAVSDSTNQAFSTVSPSTWSTGRSIGLPATVTRTAERSCASRACVTSSSWSLAPCANTPVGFFRESGGGINNPRQITGACRLVETGGGQNGARAGRPRPCRRVRGLT